MNVPSGSTMVETRWTMASSSSSITSKNTSNPSGNAAPAVPFTTLPFNATVGVPCADVDSSKNGIRATIPAMTPTPSLIDLVASIIAVVRVGFSSDSLNLCFDLDFGCDCIGSGVVFIS